MTEDGKPLEALLEDAARARRLAIVLDGDPAALELERYAEEVEAESSVVRWWIGVLNLLARANGSITLVQVAAHTAGHACNVLRTLGADTPDQHCDVGTLAASIGVKLIKYEKAKVLVYRIPNGALLQSR